MSQIDRSMPGKLEAMIKAKGEYTKYENSRIEMLLK